ncbi:hypothetical protein DCC62_17930 [candidate division KSB1 bacterium]|nr:MAG: hypothetical protein DCC62_17930 [candidate division KSB1 bacterium]
MSLWPARKRNAIQLKGDLTSQINFNHQLKAGFLYRRHSVEDFQQRTQVIKTFDRNFPFEETSYKLNPQEYAIYAQDRIEYQGIIINAGVRIDGFDTGAEQFGDFFNVSRSDTLASGAIQRTQLRSANVPTKWFFGPRLGISHPISDNAAMHYSWGRFFSPPSFMKSACSGRSCRISAWTPRPTIATSATMARRAIPLIRPPARVLAPTPT